MRLFIAALVLLQVSWAEASCRVYIPEKEFLHDSGFSITFDFYKLLSTKNYVEVATLEESDLVLRIEGIEQEGRIHRAVAKMELGELKAEESVMCFTQLCAVGDYARSFNKAYKKLSKLIPVCE